MRLLNTFPITLYRIYAYFGPSGRKHAGYPWCWKMRCLYCLSCAPAVSSVSIHRKHSVWESHLRCLVFSSVEHGIIHHYMRSNDKRTLGYHPIVQVFLQEPGAVCDTLRGLWDTGTALCMLGSSQRFASGSKVPSEWIDVRGTKHGGEPARHSASLAVMLHICTGT